MAELRLAGARTLEEANQVLSDFLPRFNQRFGVPAAQPESAYQPVDPELDLGGVRLFAYDLNLSVKRRQIVNGGRIFDPIFCGVF